MYVVLPIPAHKNNPFATKSKGKSIFLSFSYDLFLEVKVLKEKEKANERKLDMW